MFAEATCELVRNVRGAHKQLFARIREKKKKKTRLGIRMEEGGKSQYDLKIPSWGRAGDVIYSINKAGINAECIFGGRRGWGSSGTRRAQTPFDRALPPWLFRKENKGQR